MDPADTDEVDANAPGDLAGTASTPDGSGLPVTLSDDLVEQARAEGVDLDRLKDAAVPDAPVDVNLTADTHTDGSATVPVQDHRKTDLTNRLRRDTDFRFIQDDQVRRLIDQGVNYTERIGQFLLNRDDLIPTVRERLKSLITGEQGLMVEPADADSDADTRLADHLEEKYRDTVRPPQVIDRILRENLMNARAVLRSTDLKELDLGELDYLRDGITGEEIYVQDRATVYTFDVDDVADGDDSDAVQTSGTGHSTLSGIDLERETVDAQPLVIGDHVFDISLYDSPPLEAVADTAVNKMVLQRLKARKAEITSFGAVYATVEPPSYLPEDQYFDRVADDDWDGEGQPPTKLERAMRQNIQSAFDTLKDFQSGTVMSVPSFWTLEQLDIPDSGEPLDDQIRGYNRDISRRLLVPLDLIELQSGSELSRETMFRTLMTTIAGWRREIIRVFDQFAQVQADIHDIDGDVEHRFPPLQDAETKQVISALQYAGVAGLSQAEVRQMLNTVQGVDLEVDQGGDGSAEPMPPEGGPDDPDTRTDQMRQMLEDQRRGDDDDDTGQDDAADAPADAGYHGGDGSDGSDGDDDRETFDSEQAARERADELGCDGAHQMPNGDWMPCGSHSAYDDVTAAHAVADGPRDQRLVRAAQDGDVDLTVPDAVQSAAQDALDARDDPDVTVDGMTDTGWGTAEMLAGADSIDPGDVVGATDAMANWWARHADHTLDTSGERTTLDRPDDGNPWADASYTAGKGWGGVAGARWAWQKAAELTDAENWRDHLDRLSAARIDAQSDGISDQAARVLRDSPFLPDPPADGSGLTIDRDTLRNYLAWVLAGRPSLEAFDPVLHPRGPDGKFVERPYDIPDDVWSTVENLDGGNTLDRLVDEGELDRDDLDALLSDPNISIDDVPNDVNDRDDLRERIDQGDSPLLEDTGDDGDTPDLSDIDPLDDTLFTDTPDRVEDYDRGDIVQVERDGQFEVAEVVEPGGESAFEPLVENADGEQYRAVDGGSFVEGDISGVLVPERLERDDTGGDGGFPEPDEVTEDDPRLEHATRNDIGPGDIAKIDGPDGETVVGEVIEQNANTRIVEGPDGERHEVSLLSDWAVRKAVVEDQPLYQVDPNDDDIDGGWETNFAASKGDYVRFRDRERGDGPWTMGRITMDMSTRTEVVTPDGETTPIGSRGVEVQKYRPPVTDLDADSFVQADDDFGTVDVTERDGDPGDIRAEVDQGGTYGDQIPGEAVRSEAIPEGALIGEGSGHYQVLGYSERYDGTPTVELQSEHGGVLTFKAGKFDRRGFKRYEPRPDVRATVDDWGDDDRALVDRKQAVRETLDDVVPKFDQNDAATSLDVELPISDDDFDRVKDSIADELARAKSKEHVERVIGRLQALGDEKARASASPDLKLRETGRTRFQIGRDDEEDTIVHELGHIVGYTYGFSGTSNDMDGETSPMPSHKWQSPEFDAPEKYGLAAPPDEQETNGEGATVGDEYSFFQRDDWTDEVEAQAGNGLDGRNFTSPDDDFAETAEAGQMIRMDDTPSYGEPQNWRITDTEDLPDLGLDADPPEDLADRFGRTAITAGSKVVTLEDLDGNQVDAVLRERPSEPTLHFADDSDYIGRERVAGTRQSVPDDWGLNTPDADDHLNTMDLSDDPEEAMRVLADRVNRAWYRQAAATREHGERRAAALNIKSGYSAKNAHETMSRIHEVMRSGSSTGKDLEGLRSLVRHHPDLLEAYRQVYTIPGNRQALLNGILGREGYDERIGGGMTPMGAQADRIRDLYAED